MPLDRDACEYRGAPYADSNQSIRPRQPTIGTAKHPWSKDLYTRSQLWYNESRRYRYPLRWGAAFRPASARQRRRWNEECLGTGASLVDTELGLFLPVEATLSQRRRPGPWGTAWPEPWPLHTRRPDRRVMYGLCDRRPAGRHSTEAAVTRLPVSGVGSLLPLLPGQCAQRLPGRKEWLGQGEAHGEVIPSAR